METDTQRIKICFVKTHEDARLPERNNKEPLVGDSGYDVYAVEDTTIPANDTANVAIGLEIGFITPGYWIRVESRSGLFFKHGITSFCGILDNAYRGRLAIALINNTNIDYQVKKGDRISQLVIYKLIEPETCWTENKEETSRGDKGFGSSGR
jgi:dUTP pyrophosphatase